MQDSGKLCNILCLFYTFNWFFSYHLDWYFSMNSKIDNWLLDVWQISFIQTHQSLEYQKASSHTNILELQLNVAVTVIYASGEITNSWSDRMNFRKKNYVRGFSTGFFFNTPKFNSNESRLFKKNVPRGMPFRRQHSATKRELVSIAYLLLMPNAFCPL